MDMSYWCITILYAREYDEVVNSLLVQSAMTGAEILDEESIKAYRSAAPDWELSDIAELRASLQKNLPELSHDLIGQRVYFEATPSGERSMYALERRIYEQYGREIEILSEDAIRNDHWEDEWKKYYKPLDIGKSIRILPAWIEEEAEGRQIIRIDPGMAFGTGTHETTHLCLELLEELSIANGGFHGMECLDIGGGSGILSIYMKQCGAKCVVATDIDSDALRSAENNARLNHVSIKVVESDLFRNVPEKYDVICANLLADIVIRMLEEASSHLKEEGILILSGILTERGDDVEAALKKNHFVIRQRQARGEWISYLVTQAADLRD